jgi:adenylylsulfate kinase-like enzyme
VSDDPIAVLWLCGPPGVGKTTVGWEIYSQLTRAGIETGYVDIDQLGICYPEPASDPGRHRMKAHNLGAVVASFQAVGARCVVVSGVVDAAYGVHVDQIPQAVLAVCRLRAGQDELRQRLVGRRAQVEHMQDVLREADDMDASTIAEVCIDTSGLSVAEVVRQVRERTGGWPVLTSPSRSPPAATPTGCAASAPDGPILWLCGVTGVGKSTVGFTIYQKALRARLTTAYVDLDQIGFCGPAAAGHRVRARNLASMWQTYRTAGTQRLVVVGPVEDEAAVRVYADALPAATMTLCRLHAGRDQLTRRIMLRRQGGSWSQPGDPLRGQSVTHLLRIVDQAVADADALECAAIGLRIDTDGRTVEEAANVIVAQSGWLERVE